MKQPQALQAIVDLCKLSDYCLNPLHPRGRHKARVFQAVLGLTQQQAPLLREELLEAVRMKEGVKTYQDEFGTHYQIDFEMTGPRGKALVRSFWIAYRDETVPRLTTCHIL